MSVYDYMDALKLGNKEYRNAISNGEYPYLPVLDEILKHVEIEKEVNLGLVELPLNRIVGTSTAGRTQAFARNFMPLLEYGSEFSAKWASLSDAQVEEGIRDPIKVYEYLNRFYVVEGNKRVSVMKFYDAVTIMGNVTRKVPKRTDDLENKIYYEFLDFYEITGINSFYVSRLGFFNKVLELTGGTEPWDSDKRMEFNSAFKRFRKVFKSKGGSKLPIKSGDAMVSFLTFYGFDKMKEMTSGQMEDNVVKIWNEFIMLTQGEQVDLVMNPKAEKKEHINKKILNYLLPSREKKYKAVFVYNKTPEQSDWIYAHELGRLYLEEHFPQELEAVPIVITESGDKAAERLEEIISDGADVIFTVTPQLMDATLKAAVEHPEVKMLNCSLNTPHRYIRTYYGRMYEAKFLTGMIAGAMAENDNIGYIADYPIYGAIANINAFALGAKMVNPRARVFLQWSTVKDSDMIDVFIKNNVRYLAGQDLITPESPSREFGLFYRGMEGPVNMAMPVFHWGVFYEKLIQSILSGSWKRDGDESAKAYNYWWGISAGVIDLICSKNVPLETSRLVEMMKDAIIKDVFHPFSHELLDQKGNVKNEKERTMSPEEIMEMDWLLDNVVGEIPKLADLESRFRPVVEIVGVNKEETEVSAGEQ
ncbi:MAG: BMP family ABC transporter substrate-binding protein [Lachnospira sp.]|nr:BMP family ABC transporter substrate-binding protein [Lachnospira sp.]